MIKKSLSLIPKAGLICNQNFCSCDNAIKKIMEEQKLKIIKISMNDKKSPTQEEIKILDKEINQKMRNIIKCD